MSQPPVDLLPESIRRKCLAGVRTGQYIAAVVLAILFVVIGATHVRLELQRVSERLAETKEQADFVLRLEAQASDLERKLERANAFIDVQRRLAWPLEISSLLATAVNNLPESASIDRIDINAGASRPGRSPRTSRHEVRTEGDNLVRGEMAGFAASDDEIAELVNQLQETPPFHNVTLDFSRSRNVRGVRAREFRLSFRIDLSQQYEVEHLALMQAEESEDVSR